MYKFEIVSMFDIPKMKNVADILYKCGKDMSKKYDLHHWDNPKLKSFLIAEYCSTKNVVYLVYSNKVPVATFQVKIKNKIAHFEKLATLPEFSGKGIGSLCMKAIEKIALKNKCSKVAMEVYEPSKHALDFYVNRGYKKVSVINTLKYKEIKMEKELSKMKKLLIIGAGFLQDFVIQKSKAMGYETLTVDADPNAIGFKHADKYAVINIVDEKACLEYAKENKIDGVLTAATDYGVLTASYIAEHMGLPGLKYEVSKLIKNKYRVRKCLYESHADDTEQAYEVDGSTDIATLSEKISYPVMVKPCDGSGSRGASRVDDAGSLKKACEYAMDGSITHRAVIESFITGEEYGAESLVINGEIHVLAIMKKWMTKPPYYAELGHAIPSGLPFETEQKAIHCVYNAIKALGIDFGSVNIDMLITKEGKVNIIDIGARMGGNMIGPCVIPYGTGIDYMGAMIQNAVGDPIDLKVKKHGAVATKLLAFDEGVVKTVPDIEVIEKEYDVEIYHHLENGMHVNEYHTNLDGCGYIVAKNRTVDEAKAKADAVYQKIKEELF